MADLYLELYKGHLVAQPFAGLPGAGRYVGGALNFYCVLIPRPAAGSAAASYIAPVPGDANVGATTHGTDTLPAGTTAFIPTQIGIWWPKYPPYHFEVISPAGDTILLNPPMGGDPSRWFMLPVPQNDGIGVWTIRVICLPEVVPVSIGGRTAHLNPHDLNFAPVDWFHQPLLRVVGSDQQPPDCPELSGIEVDGCAPGTVNFHANIAVPAAVQEITWDFGDGTPEAVGIEDASHAYAALPPGGQYIVSVTVLRPQGCTPRTQTATAIVEPCEESCPVAMIDNILLQAAAQCNADGTRDVTVQPVLNPSASPVDSFRWEFSDGSDPVTVDGSASPTITHRFLAVGTGASELTVTLVVVREDGCSDTMSRTISVPGCPRAECPTMSNAGPDGTVCVANNRRRVTLDADISGGGVVQFIWDFGDGNTETLDAGTASGPRTTHDYNAPGTYQVTLTVIGPDTCRTQSRFTIQVASCAPGVPGCMDRNAINYNPNATIDDGSCRYDGHDHDGDGDGPGSLCCWLIWLWFGGFVSGWVLGYFGLWWPAAVIAFAAAAVALGLWAYLCCRRCMRRPWRCCTFIKWNVLAHAVTLAIFGVIAGSGTSSPNPWIWWVVLGMGYAWEMLHINYCDGIMPTESDKRTWPRCRCRRRR